MGIITQWDNDEQTVIRFIYQGQWTWTEFHQSIDQALVMANSVPHSIDHIYDVTDSGPLPSGALSQFRSTRARSPQRMHRQVLVGASTLVKAISQALLTLYPAYKKNFFVVDTLAEDWAWLSNT